MKSVAISIDRSDLHDFTCIYILTGSGWVAGGIVVEHPGGGLDHSVAETI